MSWAYGLVEKEVYDSKGEKEKVLILCEVYTKETKEKKKIDWEMFLPVDWKDLKELDIATMVSSDLFIQIPKKKYHLKWSDCYDKE